MKQNADNGVVACFGSISVIKWRFSAADEDHGLSGCCFAAAVELPETDTAGSFVGDVTG